MLIGSADVNELAQGASQVPVFSKSPIEFPRVTCLQLTAEMRGSAREALLPPSLHPTIPAVLILQVYDVAESQWGAFRYGVARVSCRSGVRARGFTTAAVVDGDSALEGLRTLLGFPARPGRIEFRHGYDGVSVKVTVDGDSVLEIEAIDPEPLGGEDVQYTGTLNLAHTPNGLRLMQVEAHSQSSQVERLQARLPHFVGSAWGSRLLVPVNVIAASVATMALSFPPVRFVCRPDELAFTGTEPAL